MSLLAEVVVEEWLNRQGYFTIRGIKQGYDEIDLLAIRPRADGTIERRHIEVQASIRPMSYISQLPKQVQKNTGRAANTPTRTPEELEQGVLEWVEKKFNKPVKKQLRESLAKGEWTFELVINNVKSKNEVMLIESHNIVILELKDIVKALRAKNTLIKAASGADLLELMHLASHDGQSIEAEAAIIAAADGQTLTEVLPAEDLPTHEDINKLLAYLPLFDKPGRKFVKKWAGGEHLGERSFSVSYPEYENDVADFFALATQPCWTNRNYQPETAGQMLEDEQAISKADLADIRTMLTFCVRGERFCDGHWESVLKSGKVVAILKRLQQISLSPE